jgi:hypothetical protein
VAIGDGMEFTIHGECLAASWLQNWIHLMVFTFSCEKLTSILRIENVSLLRTFLFLLSCVWMLRSTFWPTVTCVFVTWIWFNVINVLGNVFFPSQVWIRCDTISLPPLCVFVGIMNDVLKLRTHKSNHSVS